MVKPMWCLETLVKMNDEAAETEAAQKAFALVMERMNAVTASIMEELARFQRQHDSPIAH